MRRFFKWHKMERDYYIVGSIRLACKALMIMNDIVRMKTIVTDALKSVRVPHCIYFLSREDAKCTMRTIR